MVATASTMTAQAITVGGSDWTAPVTAITEAGNNYVGSTESINPAQITITGTIPIGLLSNAVRISVSQNNVNWNSNLALAVRRTGNGSPCNNCVIEGNTLNEYTTVNQAASTSFMILRIYGLLAGGTYSNIPVQVRLSGISVTVPSAAYQANIVFTISAL